MKKIVISLGGSIAVPDNVDVKLLIDFRKLIVSYIKKGYKFVIVVGGGKVCRRYQKAACQITDLHPDDLDWLGIHATRLNAHLLRTIFRDYAHKIVIKDPTDEIDFKEDILIAGGWKPGRSTDNTAVMLAKKFGIKTVINLTNIDHVYDKDPRFNKDAKPLDNISWENFLKITGEKWDPGKNVPFDPVASKLASQAHIQVLIMNGQNMNNLKNYLEEKEFEGTVVK
ncbi:MAG: Uridylate kinase [Candidatus Woesearchaeota archaeon]|nr:Uridylate kinase [Candidatus Woesearchaeota archaeon]